jgi:hypothetical protein
MTPHSPLRTVIVGGGMSGILLALRLSRHVHKMSENSVLLIEKQPFLGGRLFFSNPHKNSAGSVALPTSSGPGFEAFDSMSLDVLQRHFQGLLSEEELEFLRKSYKNFVFTKNRYFVKKSFLPLCEVLQGHPDFLSKRDAQLLKYLTTAPPHKEGALALDKTIFWKELQKSSKETLAQVLGALVGPHWQALNLVQVCRLLQEFFDEKNHSFVGCCEYPFPFFSQDKQNLFGNFLKQILQNRNIQVITSCTLLCTRLNAQKHFVLDFQHASSLVVEQCVTQKLVMALPLTQCVGLLPKNFFSAAQARFVSRVRPVSLLACEFFDFSPLAALSQWPSQAQSGSSFLFPIERAQALFTCDQRMIFLAKLDCEHVASSAHPEALPAVAREAISRLRRAAARMIDPKFLSDIKKHPAWLSSPLGKKTFLHERVVLLPVAYAVPEHTPPQLTLTDPKMAVEGLFCCGDSFANPHGTNNSKPFFAVVDSVQRVCEELLKSYQNEMTLNIRLHIKNSVTDEL